MANQCMIRIIKELSDLQKEGDLSLAAACKDQDVRNVRALIIGPPDTPYEFGFFEFNIKFGRDYPQKAPAVTAITTNHGRTRFNPNIYAGGKVCLSILGTWRGEPREEWSPAQGLESILISIQSLLSANPYENEPGFENADSKSDKENQRAYVAKIRHETIRISVVERMEQYLGLHPGLPLRSIKPFVAKGDADNDDGSFEPFKDKCKLRFLWYYDSYLQTTDRESREHKDNEQFVDMPFEGGGNNMDGHYSYTEVRRRLVIIKEKLDAETETWAEQGKQAVEKDLSIALNLRRQFEQIVENFSHCGAGNIDIKLVDDNPFVWQIILFGRGKNLDNGIFKIRMSLSPRFPAEQPRVRVLTPMFHHRVASHGQLCYLIDNRHSESLRHHVDAIISAIEDDEPAYDPRTIVNPEASKLLWGTPEERKQYNRRLRRSAEESHDYF